MNKKIKTLITISILSASILIQTPKVSANYEVNTLNDFKSEVLTHMENRDTNFLINYTGNSKQLIEQFDSILLEIPKSDKYLELSLVSRQAFVNGSDGNLFVKISANYIINKNQEDIVNKKTSEIISLAITPYMSSEQKVKSLHDYVCNHVSYDETLEKNSAYDALIYGKTVCLGYALLLNKLYTKAGIPNHIVTGSVYGTNHAWNMVMLDNKWYHIDATSDDATNSNSFYKVSNNTLNEYGFDWDKSKYPLVQNDN